MDQPGRVLELVRNQSRQCEGWGVVKVTPGCLAWLAEWMMGPSPEPESKGG